MHEHAYFKWSDAARAARVFRCPRCTQPLTYGGTVYGSLTFCSAECLASFRRDVERSSVGMPS